MSNARVQATAEGMPKLSPDLSPLERMQALADAWLSAPPEVRDRLLAATERSGTLEGSESGGTVAANADSSAEPPFSIIRRDPMQTPSVHAAAEGVLIDRRTSLSLTSETAASQTDDDAASNHFVTLLERLASLRAEERSLRTAYDVALAGAPSWAAPGLDKINSKGERFGGVVRWPEIAEPKAPASDYGYLYVRYGPRQAFDNAMLLAPKADDKRLNSVASRRRCRLAGIKNARKVITRIREQNAVLDAAGVTAAYNAWDASLDSIDALELEIQSVRVRNGNPNYVAGMMYLAFTEWLWRTDLDCTTSEEALFTALKAFHCQTSGVVHAMVGELIAKDKSDEA